MTRIRMLSSALYALVMAGALTFGAVQAFASPTPQQGERGYCPEEQCNSVCGGPGSWYCEWWGGGTCVCF